MNPFDDALPEEQEAKHRDLIELVQRARRSPLPDTSAEQSQVIARVQQRLAELEYTANQTESAELQWEDTSMQFDENELEQAGTIRSLPIGFTRVPGATSRRKRRSMHILNTLAAILLVGLLIGGSLVLFRRSPQSTTSGPTPASGLGGTPVTVHAESGGLGMSMSVTPGPYFLSELVVVDMTLTNPTRTTFHLLGRLTSGSFCKGPVLNAYLSGGHSPHFTIPAEQFIQQFIETIQCPWPGLSDLPPGQTVTIRQYVPIESSGQVTLKVYASFAPANTSNANPLPVHWLTLQLNVASQIPPDRTISVQRHGADLQVTIPHIAHPQLAYIYAINHPDSSNCAAFWWQSAPTNVLHISLCKTGQWAYAVGAASYAIAVGDFSR